MGGESLAVVLAGFCLVLGLATVAGLLAIEGGWRGAPAPAPPAAAPAPLGPPRPFGARRFGVEIECFVPSRVALAAALGAAGLCGWRLARDASLRGGGSWRAVELISPPLAGEAGLRAVRAALAVLAAAGAATNGSCGLHVHHDAADLDAAALRALVRSYEASRGAIERAVAPARRAAAAPAYTGRWRWDEQLRLRAARTRREAARTASTRFRCVNLRALPRHGTVEFRQHDGTVDPARVVGWLRCTQALTDAAAAGRRVRARTPEELVAALALDRATARLWLPDASAAPAPPAAAPRRAA